METAKRAKLEEESPNQEKESKLKCHEMRLIFQHLPTSELIRFISNQPNHPLGKFWSQELKFVIEKRLPFSIKANDTSSGGGTPSDHVIFDCNDSRVAEIKHPKQFYLSPICELIESAELAAIAVDASRLPQSMLAMPDILPSLTNLDTLVLSAHDVTRCSLRDLVDVPAALNSDVMARINSLKLADLLCYGQLWTPILEIISRATNLKKLSVPYVDLNLQILLADRRPPDLPGHYSSLESLSIKHLDVQSVQPLLQLITARFNGLRELFLPVRAPIREYLAAFRALPSLATLGLDECEIGCYRLEETEKQLVAADNDAPVVSVTELLIAGWSFERKATRALLAMLSKFPNVQTFGADFHWNVADFASAVCAGGVFRHLQALKLFGDNHTASLPGFTLLQFIRDNIDHLPNSVDLSHVRSGTRKLDSDFLVDLCLALQGGRITSLFLKDLVHWDAVRCLRANFALTQQDKSTPHAKVGKILAWIDEGSTDERRIRSGAAGWPLEVSDFTDFRIEACKTSGPLKGSAFKIRISDCRFERKRLLDV